MPSKFRNLTRDVCIRAALRTSALVQNIIGSDAPPKKKSSAHFRLLPASQASTVSSGWETASYEEEDDETEEEREARIARLRYEQENLWLAECADRYVRFHDIPEGETEGERAPSGVTSPSNSNNSSRLGGTPGSANATMNTQQTGVVYFQEQPKDPPSSDQTAPLPTCFLHRSNARKIKVVPFAPRMGVKDWLETLC